MRAKRLVIPGALLLAVACARAPVQASDDPVKSFQDFWTPFRAAVVAGKCDDLASMARFPFRTRGPMDSDPVKQLDREAFLKACPALLEADTGLTERGETMKQHVEKKAAVSAKDVKGTKARVANFAFESAGGKWSFVLAYAEE